VGADRVERPRVDETSIRAVGEQGTGLLERLTQRRDPEADGSFLRPNVRHLARRLCAPEPTAPRHDPRRGVGRLDAPAGEGERTGREPAVGVALEQQHLQAGGGVTRENDRGRFTGDRGPSERLLHGAGRITRVSVPSTAWIGAVPW
jgi:hypothetical protein